MYYCTTALEINDTQVSHSANKQTHISTGYVDSTTGGLIRTACCCTPKRAYLPSTCCYVTFRKVLAPDGNCCGFQSTPQHDIMPHSPNEAHRRPSALCRLRGGHIEKTSRNTDVVLLCSHNDYCAAGAYTCWRQTNSAGEVRPCSKRQETTLA